MSEPRKIRKGDARLIGGVCSGIGQFLGIDAWVVRIVFLILAVTPPGVGILLYLLLWLLMPASAEGPRTVGDAIRAGAGDVAGDVRRVARDLGIKKPQPQ